MSKDRGSKNVKKKPADKTAGKKKVSDYKLESGGKINLEPLTTKTDAKGGKKP